MIKVQATIVALLVFFSLPWVQAQTASNELFYRTCIAAKIAQCERKAELATSKSENLRLEGERALDQLSFYQNRREELVQELIQTNLGANRHRVNHFLIKAYVEETAPVVTAQEE